MLQLILVEFANSLYVFLVFWFVGQFMPLREKFKKTSWIVYLGTYLLSIALNVARYSVTQTSNLSYTIVSLVLFGLSTAAVVLIFNGKLWLKLFLIAVEKITEAVLAFSYTYIKCLIDPNLYYLPDYTAPNRMILGIIEQIVFFGLGFCAVALIAGIAKIIKGDRFYKYLLFFIVPFSQILLITQISYLFSKSHGTLLGDGLLLVAGMVLSVIGDILLFSVMHQMREQAEYQRRLSLLDQQQKQYLTELESIKAITHRQQMFNHDLKNQVTTVAYLLENGDNQQASESLSELITLTGRLNEQQFCANTIVNAVINNKLATAQQYDIAFDIDVAVPDTISVSAMDLCSVFSNIIDNAINALRNVDGDRIMHLSCRCAHGLLSIAEHNSFNNSTESNDDPMHGFGLGILEYIAERYDGKFSHCFTDNEFSSELCLSLNKPTKASSAKKKTKQAGKS